MSTRREAIAEIVHEADCADEFTERWGDCPIQAEYLHYADRILALLEDSGGPGNERRQGFIEGWRVAEGFHAEELRGVGATNDVVDDACRAFYTHPQPSTEGEQPDFDSDTEADATGFSDDAPTVEATGEDEAIEMIRTFLTDSNREVGCGVELGTRDVCDCVVCDYDRLISRLRTQESEPRGYVVAVGATWDTRELAEGHKLYLWQTLDREKYTFTVHPVGSSARPQGETLREALWAKAQAVQAWEVTVEENEAQAAEIERLTEGLALLSEEDHTYHASNGMKWCTACDGPEPLPAHEADCVFSFLTPPTQTGETE
jgi:hypothetical protein